MKLLLRFIIAHLLIVSARPKDVTPEIIAALKAEFWAFIQAHLTADMHALGFSGCSFSNDGASGQIIDEQNPSEMTCTKNGLTKVFTVVKFGILKNAYSEKVQHNSIVFTLEHKFINGIIEVSTSVQKLSFKNVRAYIKNSLKVYQRMMSTLAHDITEIKAEVKGALKQIEPKAPISVQADGGEDPNAAIADEEEELRQLDKLFKITEVEDVKSSKLNASEEASKIKANMKLGDATATENEYMLFKVECHKAIYRQLGETDMLVVYFEKPQRIFIIINSELFRAETTFHVLSKQFIQYNIHFILTMAVNIMNLLIDFKTSIKTALIPLSARVTRLMQSALDQASAVPECLEGQPDCYNPVDFSITEEYAGIMILDIVYKIPPLLENKEKDDPEDKPPLFFRFFKLAFAHNSHFDLFSLVEKYISDFFSIYYAVKLKRMPSEGQEVDSQGELEIIKLDPYFDSDKNILKLCEPDDDSRRMLLDGGAQSIHKLGRSEPLARPQAGVFRQNANPARGLLSTNRPPALYERALPLSSLPVHSGGERSKLVKRSLI